MSDEINDEELGDYGPSIVSRKTPTAPAIEMNQQALYRHSVEYEETWANDTEFIHAVWDSALLGHADHIFDTFARFAHLDPNGLPETFSEVIEIPPDEDIARMSRDEWLKQYPRILRYYGKSVTDALGLRITALRKYWASNTARDHILDIYAEQEPVPYLIKGPVGLVPSQVMVVVLGLRESGKSFIMTDLAGCLATEKPWLGHEVVKSKVLLLQIEDNENLVRNRVRAWEQTNGCSPIADGSLVVVVNQDFTFIGGYEAELVTDPQGNERTEYKKYYGQTNSVRNLIDFIADEHFDVVIIDNLAAGQNDTSNMSSADVSATQTALAQIQRAGNGVSLFVVAHPDQKDQHIAGLSQQGNLINTELHVKWSPATGRRAITVTKAKAFDRTKIKPIPFEINDSKVSVEGTPVGVVRFGAITDDATDAIIEALAELDEPSTKNAIYTKVCEQGFKIERARCLKQISTLADDAVSPVIKVGQKFTLDE